MIGFNFLTTRFWIIALITYFIFFFVYMFLIKIYIKKMLYSYNHMIPGGENNKKMAISAATVTSWATLIILVLFALFSILLDENMFWSIGISLSLLIFIVSNTFAAKKSNIKIDGIETEDEYGFYKYSKEELEDMDSKSVFLNYRLYFNFTNIFCFFFSLIPADMLFVFNFNVASFSILLLLIMIIYYPLIRNIKKGDTPLTKEELKYYKDIQKENEERLNNK